MRLSLLATSLRVIHDDACPEIGPICEVREEPPQVHDQRIHLVQPLLRLDYAASELWGVRFDLPFKVLRTTIDYRRLDGTPFTPDYPNIHHRDETLAGVMDPWLMGRLGFDLGGLRWTAHAGLSIPFGRTEQDPFALGEKGQAHQHIQFGSGTVMPIAELQVSRAFGEWMGALFGQAQLSLYENFYGYQPGNRFSFGVVGAGPLVGKLRGSVGVDLLHEDSERWGGVVHEEGNLGRTDLLVGAQVSYPVGAVELSLAARVPVWQRVVGGEVSYPGLLELAVERSFD